MAFFLFFSLRFFHPMVLYLHINPGRLCLGMHSCGEVSQTSSGILGCTSDNGIKNTNMFFIIMLTHCVGPKIRFVALVTKEFRSILKTVNPHVSFTFIPCVLGLTFGAIEQSGILKCLRNWSLYRSS